MTVTEFMRKYDQPLQIVYEASFNTPTRKNTYSKDVPEDELYRAVKDKLSKSVDYYRDKLDASMNQLRRLERIREAEG